MKDYTEDHLGRLKYVGPGRSKERIPPFLEKFGELWYEYPDMRFGQLVENVLSAFMQKKRGAIDKTVFYSLMWNLEEDEWEEAMKIFREMFKHG